MVKKKVVEKKKCISEKEEAFEKIDIIYNKLRYEKKNNRKNEFNGKELWQYLYEEMPYRFILGNQEILDLITNLCIDNYKENLNLLKVLINKCEDIKYSYNEKKEDQGKDERGVKVENKVIKKKNHVLVNYEKEVGVYKENNDDIIDEYTEFKLEPNNINKDLEGPNNRNEIEVNKLLTSLGKEMYINGDGYQQKDKISCSLRVISGKQLPSRREVKLNRIVRSFSVVQILKRIYGHTCQLCGTRLEIAPNIYYSEVHHIRPLGKLHKGRDTTDNAVVLCPNCHKLFDRGGIGINEKTMTIMNSNKNNYLSCAKLNIKHEIDLNNIKYHNDNIYFGSKYETKINNTGNMATKIINDTLNPLIKENTDDIIDYGDTIEILDLGFSEIITVNMKAYWEQNDMPPLQRKLINKRKGDIIKFNEYRYKIIKIKK